MKYLKQKINNLQEMLINYKELEWNISQKDKYNDLIMKQMDAQEKYNDLLDKAQQDLFKEDEVLHQDKDEAFEQDRDDLTTSTFDPIKFVKQPINEEIVKNGMAVIYDFKESDEKMDALEAEAKKQKLGIWRGAFQLPKEYRKSHPRK